MGSYSDTIFRSKLPDIAIPDHLPLHSYCLQHLAAHAQRACLVDVATGASFSYADVDLYSRRIAAGLHRLGVRPGHVILLLLPNCPAFPLLFLAASRLGAVASTENPFHTSAEIAKQAAASGARLVVTERVHVAKVLPLGLQIVVADDDDGAAVPEGCMAFSELMSADEAAAPEVEVAPDDLVALPYSSGTTGLPKGVMLTHRGLVTNVAQQVDGSNPNMWLTAEDVILCVLPLFHIYSLNSVLLCGLRTGATILIMRKFDVAAMMEVVERERVTFAPLVPPIVVEMAKKPGITRQFDGSSVRMIMSGAAPMGSELQETLMATFPNARIGQGYGMTEAGPVLSLSLAFAKEPFEVQSGSCGTTIRNAELKVVDPDTGLSLPRNLNGEICIRGKQIMKGYLNDPEATAQTIDKDGWLHTGDIGYVDDDDQVYIVDRLKELIKYKGFQVAPAELEALLLTHPDIIDAATVPMKDDLCGEIPVAFIVCAQGSDITANEIKQFVSKQVVFYKRIHKVFFVEAIPKGPTGKILRKILKAELTNNTC